jgi:rhodanese-related sulfurtransferase
VVEQQEATTEIEAQRAIELLRSADAQLIDVRRAFEWDAGRIEGARHIEMNEVSGEAESIPRDRPVIFYCRTGNRSSLAAAAFRQAGWDAHNLAGGITAWVEQGLAIEPEDGFIAPPKPVG